MKKLLYTFSLLLIAGNVMSQAITLSSSPGVKTSAVDSCGIPSSLATLPSIAPATNASWDFGATALQSTPYTYQYRAKTTGFPAASFSDSGSYTLSSSAGISFKVWRNVSQGASAVIVAGEEVLTRQAKSLMPITGGAVDSFIIPTQVIAFSTPLPILKFPATMSSAWSATTPRTINFNITASNFSLNNTPGQVKEIRGIMDSVVGWGRMKVPVIGKAASSWIAVLQVRHKDAAIDSFYLNGALAPAAMMTALGLTQGQRTVTTSTYFYRAAAFRPLFEGLHFDSSFSTALSRVYLHATDLPQDATAVPTMSAGNLRVYPNPLRNGALHVDMPGNTRSDWHYSLINMGGQQVATGALPLDATMRTVTLNVPKNLAAGIYYLKLEQAGAEQLVLPLELE